MTKILEGQSNIHFFSNSHKTCDQYRLAGLNYLFKCFTFALMFSFHFSSSTVGGVTLNKRKKLF